MVKIVFSLKKFFGEKRFLVKKFHFETPFFGIKVIGAINFLVRDPVIEAGDRPCNIGWGQTLS